MWAKAAMVVLVSCLVACAREPALFEPAAPAPAQTPVAQPPVMQPRAAIEPTPTPSVETVSAPAAPAKSPAAASGPVAVTAVPPESEELVDVVVAHEPRMPRNVQLFTQARCVWCSHARTWLGDNHVPYDDLDIADPVNLRAMLALVGNKNVGTPVLHWDDTVLAGYRDHEMERLLYPEGRTSTTREPRHHKRVEVSDTPRDYSPLYTYVDGEGALQIVSNLDAVPRRFRASARRRDSH